MLNISGLKTVQAERLEIAKQKNNDYAGKGDNIGITGVKGIAIRLLDKAMRLHNLVCGEAIQKVKDESVRDTLLDAANYSDFGVMLLDKTWGKLEPYPQTTVEGPPNDTFFPAANKIEEVSPAPKTPFKCGRHGEANILFKKHRGYYTTPELKLIFYYWGGSGCKECNQLNHLAELKNIKKYLR